MAFVTVDWLSDHVNIPAGLDAQKLAADLVRVGLEEESIVSPKVTGPLVVGRVLSFVPEEQKNGKIINWCQVDVGDFNPIDEQGSPLPARGIICGAKNFKEKDLVVVALSGAVLPGNFVISARKTYGHISDGMLCSSQELGLGEEGSGIIILPPVVRDKLGNSHSLEVGQDARSLLGLDREILEINITPDRGYCFSMRGVAREFACSTGESFKDPALAITAEVPQQKLEVELRAVAQHNQPGCNRFVLRKVTGMDPLAQSPLWLQSRLRDAGMRPISLVVDITNYVMLDLGQPLHAYDATEIRGGLVVKNAEAGQNITTLDDQERKLHPEDIVVCDRDENGNERVLAIAGVMGANVAGVSSQTTAVLIEAANFDQVAIARSARRHKLPSEAAKRFERGVDINLCDVAAQRVVDLLVLFGGGKVADLGVDLYDPKPRSSIFLDESFPTQQVGIDYTETQIVAALEAVGCEVVKSGSGFEVTPPTWRNDLTTRQDLVEEIARLNGYENIPAIPPAIVGSAVLTTRQLTHRRVARALAYLGLTEVLTYPFISASRVGEFLVGQEIPDLKLVDLANPLNAEQRFLRPNLLLTLVDAAKRNVSRGLSQVAIFELGSVVQINEATLAAPTLPGGVRPSEQQLIQLAQALPAQPWQVAALLTGEISQSGWWGSGRIADWADAKSLVVKLGEVLKVNFEFVVNTDLPWHPGRSGNVLLGSQLVGTFGQLHPKVLKNLGLPTATVGFELDLDVIVAHLNNRILQAKPVSAFPLVKEDFAFVVAEDIPAAKISEVIRQAAGDLLESLSIFDVFRSEGLGQGLKSVAFSLTLRANDRTLTGEEIRVLRESVIAAVEQSVAGKLRS